MESLTPDIFFFCFLPKFSFINAHIPRTSRTENQVHLYSYLPLPSIHECLSILIYSRPYPYLYEKVKYYVPAKYYDDLIVTALVFYFFSVFCSTW